MIINDVDTIVVFNKRHTWYVERHSVQHGVVYEKPVNREEDGDKGEEDGELGGVGSEIRYNGMKRESDEILTPLEKNKWR